MPSIVRTRLDWTGLDRISRISVTITISSLSLRSSSTVVYLWPSQKTQAVHNRVEEDIIHTLLPCFVFFLFFFTNFHQCMSPFHSRHFSCKPHSAHTHPVYLAKDAPNIFPSNLPPFYVRCATCNSLAQLVRYRLYPTQPHTISITISNHRISHLVRKFPWSVQNKFFFFSKNHTYNTLLSLWWLSAFRTLSERLPTLENIL